MGLSGILLIVLMGVGIMGVGLVMLVIELNWRGEKGRGGEVGGDVGR